MTDHGAAPVGGRLRAVGGGAVADTALLGEAMVACVAAAEGGLARRALGPAVAARLGVGVDDLVPDALSVALGLLIASGRVDESGGRLVSVAQERRRAG